MNNQSSYITSLVQIAVLQTAAHAILTDTLIVLYVTIMNLENHHHHMKIDLSMKKHAPIVKSC